MSKSLFQKQQATKLAKQFGLRKLHEGTSLYDRLEGTSNVYFMYKSESASLERNQEVREQLKSITRAASKVQRLLNQLSPDAEFALGQTMFHSGVETQKIAIGAYQESDRVVQDLTTLTGLKFQIARLAEDEGFLIIAPDLTDIKDALEHLKTHTDNAAVNLPKRTAGRRQSDALRMWVINCASIWRDYKGAPFSLTYHKGRATSDAGSFCVTALHVIDPTIPEKKIVTAMRTYVSEQRKEKSQERGGKVS